MDPSGARSGNPGVDIDATYRYRQRTCMRQRACWANLIKHGSIGEHEFLVQRSVHETQRQYYLNPTTVSLVVQRNIVNYCIKQCHVHDSSSAKASVARGTENPFRIRLNGASSSSGNPGVGIDATATHRYRPCTCMRQSTFALSAINFYPLFRTQWAWKGSQQVAWISSHLEVESHPYWGLLAMLHSMAEER